MTAAPAFTPSSNPYDQSKYAGSDQAKEARHSMIVSQLRTNKVYNEAVLAAFGTVPRELFVAPHARNTAYLDEDVRAGVGAGAGDRHTMEPMVLARLLEAANIQPLEKVLLVGANGGYEAAILATICDELYVLEEDDAIQQQVAERLQKANNFSNITFISGPLTEGPRGENCQSKEPFSVILVNGAVAGIPTNFQKGLNDGGRLLAIRRSTLTTNGQATIIRCHQGNCASQPLFDANCPYLVGFAPITDTFEF